MWMNPSLFAKMPDRWRCFTIIKGPDNKRLFSLSISFAPNIFFPPPATYYSLTHTHTNSKPLVSVPFQLSLYKPSIFPIFLYCYFLYKNIYVKFNHVLKVIAFENVELSFFKRSQPLFDTQKNRKVNTKQWENFVNKKL